MLATTNASTSASTLARPNSCSKLSPDEIRRCHVLSMDASQAAPVPAPAGSSAGARSKRVLYSIGDSSTPGAGADKGTRQTVPQKVRRYCFAATRLQSSRRHARATGMRRRRARRAWRHLRLAGSRLRSAKLRGPARLLRCPAVSRGAQKERPMYVERMSRVQHGRAHCAQRRRTFSASSTRRSRCAWAASCAQRRTSSAPCCGRSTSDAARQQILRAAGGVLTNGYRTGTAPASMSLLVPSAAVTSKSAAPSAAASRRCSHVASSRRGSNCCRIHSSSLCRTK